MAHGALLRAVNMILVTHRAEPNVFILEWTGEEITMDSNMPESRVWTLAENVPDKTS